MTEGEGSKEDSQHQLRLHMTDGGVPKQDSQHRLR